MRNKLFFGIIFGIIFLNGVYALGVTPGRTTFDFEPDSVKDIGLTVINSEHKNLNLQVYIQGELALHINSLGNYLHMNANEEEKRLNTQIRLPNSLSPGLHTAEIVVKEDVNPSGDGKAVIGASLAVASQVAIYVPYPGKYVEGQLTISGNAKKRNFVIHAFHRGKEKIDKLSAEIHIFDFSGKEVKVLNTNEISLGSQEKKEISTSWDVDSPMGKYKAKIIVKYDDQEFLLEKDFEIGEFVLDLKQLYVKDFKLGEIAKFNAIVENKWNEPITQAYTEMRVYDSNLEELADVKSSTYDIPAGLQTTMNYYWDTKGISQGLYQANIILNYADKKTQQDLKLDVKPDSIDVIGLGYVISSEESSGNGGMTTILGIIIGFLVLLNLVWFFIFRKKKMKEVEKKSK